MAIFRGNLWCCVLLLFIVRTGRPDGKRSAKGPALATATDPAGHETTFIDFGPGRQLGRIARDGEMRFGRIDWGMTLWIGLRHDKFVAFIFQDFSLGPLPR